MTCDLLLWKENYYYCVWPNPIRFVCDRVPFVFNDGRGLTRTCVWPSILWKMNDGHSHYSQTYRLTEWLPTIAGMTLCQTPVLLQANVPDWPEPSHWTPDCYYFLTTSHLPPHRIIHYHTPQAIYHPTLLIWVSVLFDLVVRPQRWRYLLKPDRQPDPSCNSIYNPTWYYYCPILTQLLVMTGIETSVPADGRWDLYFYSRWMTDGVTCWCVWLLFDDDDVIT